MMPIDGHNVQIMPSCDFQILVMPGDVLCFPKKEQFSRVNLGSS